MDTIFSVVVMDTSPNSAAVDVAQFKSTMDRTNNKAISSPNELRKRLMGGKKRL